METRRTIPAFLWVLQLAERVNGLTSNIVKEWPAFHRSGIGDQLTRAVDSIGLNISEGYSRFHLKERLHFISIAEGSLEEALFAIRRARDRGLITRLDSSILSGLLIKLSTALRAFAFSLRK